MSQPANLDRFLGLADIYDKCRPGLPRHVLEAVLSYRREAPKMIVDLGCGTGLSTRAWHHQGLLPTSTNVIGMDPNTEMLAVAKSRDSVSSYSQRWSHDTGLESSSVDVVVASQAFHWMNPETTLAEAARILTPGGLFVVIDCIWPPCIPGCWLAEREFERCRDWCDKTVVERGLAVGLARWSKSGHLESIRTKAPVGAFGWVRQLFMHSDDVGTRERLVGLAESQGCCKTLLRAGLTRDETGLTELARVANLAMGAQPRKWIWSYDIHIAIRT